MNGDQFEKLKACGRRMGFFALALAMAAMLHMVSVIHAQTSVAQPVTTETAPSDNASSEGKNVYVAGGNVRLGAAVRGDLYAAGGRITVEQPVQRDAILAGGSVAVRAAVGDDLRVAGGEINIESSVGGELLASGGKITLGRSALIGGAATLYAGQVSIEGKVNGPLKVYAEKIILNGEVAGSVELNADEIELGPLTRLGATLRYSGNAKFETAEGAVIGGAVIRGSGMNGRPDTHRDRQWHGQMVGGGSGFGYGWSGSVASIVVSFVALLAAAALFLLVFNGFVRRASSQMLAAPWWAFAASAAVLLGVPLLAVVLCITLIGIPLGIVLMILFPLMLLAGWTVGVFGIAQKLQRFVQKNAPSQTSAAMLGFFALTLLLTLLVSSLPVIGGLVLILILLLGTGGCALELHHQVRPRFGAGLRQSSSRWCT